MFEETFHPYLGRAGEYCGVDTNVAVAIGAEICGNFAKMLGKDETLVECCSFAKGIYKSVNKFLWDETECLFRPVYLKDMTFGARTAQGFFMLSDTDLSDERRIKLLKNLKGNNFNWDNIPISSVAKNDDTFQVTKTDNYQFGASWSRMVWSLINKYTIYGLAKSDFIAEKNYLAKKTVELIKDIACEFYAPDTGIGYGAKNYAWTGAHSLCIFIEELCGISYNEFTNTLTVKPQIDDKIQLLDLNLSEDVKIDILISNKRIIDLKCNGNISVDHVI